MAINFPDNPQDGEEYAASNGIVYTYNAANDSWTGALNVGSDYWSQDVGGNLYPTDTNADVWVGGDSASSPIVLGSDGNINASGTISVAGGVSSAGDGIQVASDGVVRIRRDIDAEALSIFKNGSSTSERVIVLSTDGNAAFDGTVSALGSLNANNYDIDALDFLP